MQTRDHNSELQSAWAEFKETRYFPHLDGLRAVAILMVVWHHTAGMSSATKFLGSTFHGVTLFFAISGFLITILLERERSANNRIAIGKFMARRSLRIFPLYYGMLAVYCIAVACFERGTARAADFWQNLPYFATYTSNLFVQEKEIGTIFYFAWSLSTEEQYYLVWPWLLAVFRLRTAASLAATAVLAYLFVGLVWAPSVGKSPLWQVVPISIAPAICMGSLLGLACSVEHGYLCVRRVFCRPAVQAASWIAFFLAVVLQWPMTIVSAAAVCVVASASVSRNTIGGGVLRSSPFVLLGKVSYGMYLMHMLSKQVVVKVVSMFAVPLEGIVGSLLVFLGTLAVATLAAFFSFRYLETPLLSLKSRFQVRAES